MDSSHTLLLLQIEMWCPVRSSLWQVTSIKHLGIGVPQTVHLVAQGPKLEYRTLLFYWPCSIILSSGDGGVALLQRFISHRQCSRQDDSVYQNMHGSDQQEVVVNLLFLLLLSLHNFPVIRAWGDGAKLCLLRNLGLCHFRH